MEHCAITAVPGADSSSGSRVRIAATPPMVVAEAAKKRRVEDATYRFLPVEHYSKVRTRFACITSDMGHGPCMQVRLNASPLLPRPPVLHAQSPRGAPVVLVVVGQAQRCTETGGAFRQFCRGCTIALLGVFAGAPHVLYRSDSGDLCAIAP